MTWMLWMMRERVKYGPRRTCKNETCAQESW